MVIIKKKESEIQREVLYFLQMNSYKCWKNYLGALMIRGGYHAKNPNAGQPDIYGIFKNHPGKLFAIELKAIGGKLSEEQREEIKSLENAGVYVIVARDVNVIKELLEKKENEKA